MPALHAHLSASLLLAAGMMTLACTAEDYADSEGEEFYDSEGEEFYDSEGEYWEDEEAYEIENVVFAPHDGLGPGLATASMPPLSHDGVGAFRIQQCDVSHFSKDDPIVFPKQPGATHDHMFFGNRTTNAFTTQSTLNNGTTTCPGGARNLSGYWIPSMYGSDGKRKNPTGIRVYYKGGYSLAQNQIKAPPTGLRMIAGFNLRVGSTRGAQWRGCAVDDGNARNMNGCTKGETMELWLRFPQCWDGKNLDSVDHMRHMAYTVAGKCPSSHPVSIPEISYVVSWKVDTTSTAGWRLSSDMGNDYGGESAHGDWWNAWKPQTLQAFIDGCIRAKRDCNNGNLGNGWRLVMP